MSHIVAPNAFIASALANDPATVEHHHELLMCHFVGMHRYVKFCPYLSCTHAVSSLASLATVVPTETCGASCVDRFCFKQGLVGRGSTTSK